MSHSSVRPGVRDSATQSRAAVNGPARPEATSGKSAHGDGRSKGCSHVDPGAQVGGLYRYSFPPGTDRQRPDHRPEVSLERVGYRCAECDEAVYF